MKIPLFESVFFILTVIILTLIAISVWGVLAWKLGEELFGMFILTFPLMGYASIFDPSFFRGAVIEMTLKRKSLLAIKKVLLIFK